ncbi:universal stress protein [Halobaculum sp. P14]|uniref:universal stress protein n=1 Tax=Halobaculum sp. P14 TaxID=3421638 RepID=UPI003EB6F5F8
MTRRVLVPIDSSEQSTAALEHALDVHGDAEYVLVHVVDPNRWISTGDAEGDVYYSKELEESAKNAAKELLADAEAVVRERGAAAETETLYGPPARTIVDYIDEHDFDAVVMGSHGRTGIDRLLLGSVAEKVVRRSPVPVTIVH